MESVGGGYLLKVCYKKAPVLAAIAASDPFCNFFSLVNNYYRNIYLGVGNKIVRLGADFDRLRLLQIRKKWCNFFFKSVFSRFRRCSRRTLNRSSKFFRFFLEDGIG